MKPDTHCNAPKGIIEMRQGQMHQCIPNLLGHHFRTIEAGIRQKDGEFFTAIPCRQIARPLHIERPLGDLVNLAGNPAFAIAGLGAVGEAVNVARGRAENHLHHERDRVTELPAAQGHQEPGAFPE